MSPARAAALALLSPVVFSEAAHGQDAWRLVALYGQASAPTSQGFAESGALALGREWPLGKGFGLSAEVYPLFLVRLTRVDLPERPRETVWAVAASPLLSYTFLPEKARVRIRLEAGIGLFWGFSPVPAEGSRFNFLDQLGGFFVFRLDSGSRIAVGVCRFHVSNAHLYGPVDPGLSFYSGAVSFSWPPRK